jgi:putative nucleotidyltransferase with HDIG domain
LNRRLGALIALVTVVSFALLAVDLVCFPFQHAISIDGTDSGVLLGVAFWTGLCLIGSSLAVRLPGGNLVDVSFAPIVAAMNLGGPAAAGLVSLFGAIQKRELEGKVPWYGLVANHSGILLPALLGAGALQLSPFRSSAIVDFIATFVGATVCFSSNTVIVTAFGSLRSGENLHTLLRANSGAFSSLLALAPIAWLMAQMYVTAGWWAVLLFALPLYTTRIAYTRFVEVREMFTETVSSLAEAVDKRDTFTSGHSRKVQKIAVDIGRAMKCGDEEIEALEWGGLLHDIGKIGVPDSVLLKQDRLTREERVIMNSHPRLGADIIAPVKRLSPEIPIILHHHEWFNGSGYPDRLVGDDIPKLARILHVADAFEAMTAARPYRMTPLSPAQALAELRKFGGIQFDPAVVDAFVRTDWAAGLSDPGKPGIREVPLIGQAAGGLSGASLSVGETPARASEAPASTPKGSLNAGPA